MNCDKVFQDTAKTRRMDRGFMIDTVMVEGDVVCVRQLSDLGRGQEGARIRRLIDSKGASVEVVESDTSKRTRGRPSKFSPTDDERALLEALWYHAADPGIVFERAKQINKGKDVSRHWFFRQFGPRDGSRKP